MRLHVISDLHLECGDVEIPAKEADVIVLAGDIHLGRQGLDWARAQFDKTPVVYVLGNHEFYGQRFPLLLRKLEEEARGTNIHLLENNAVNIEEWRFLGCTLWTDFSIAADPQVAMEKAERRIRDYSAIRMGAGNRALRAIDTAHFHRESVGWLKNELAEADCTRTIVVTHHAPSTQSEAPWYVGGPLTAAFASDLDELIENSGLPLWIHGHTHYNVNYTIGMTRVMSNQRGYDRDRCEGFNPGLLVDVAPTEL